MRTAAQSLFAYCAYTRTRYHVSVYRTLGPYGWSEGALLVGLKGFLFIDWKMLRRLMVVFLGFPSNYIPVNCLSVGMAVCTYILTLAWVLHKSNGINAQIIF